MDFCREFQSVETILKMKERPAGKGSLLKQIDHKLLCEIIEKLKTSLFETYNMDEITQRRVTFFLILQTDLILSRKLELVSEIGNLVRVLINGSLLVHIVWGLGFQKYFYETIFYGPSALGEELTKLVLTASLNVKDCIIAARDLAVTIFKKIRQMEKFVVAVEQNFRGEVFNKYFEHFAILLQSIIITDGALKSLSKEDVTTNRVRLQSILQLTRLCFSEPEIVNKSPAEYNFTLTYDYSNWINAGDITLLQFKCKIVECCTVCVKNANISTSLWCQWVEIDSEVQGKSFQRFIGEEMYNCMLALENSSLAYAAELISILKLMSIKPETEDDEIDRADLKTIMENVCDKSKSRNKWLAALLKVDTDEACYEECLSLIENNVPMGFDLIHEVVDFVVRCLKAPNGSDYNDRLKQLVLKSLESFSLQEQIDASKSYFETHGVTTLMKTEDFPQVFTEVFNKAVSASENFKTETQLFSGFINLFWQSPEELLMKMLGEGVSNANQTILMLKAFEILGPVCNLPGKGDNTMNKDAGLLIQTVIKFFDKMELKDQEEANFVQMVSSLVNNSIIDREILLELCIAPKLCQCLRTHHWNIASLCLKIIEATIKDIELKKLIPMVVVLSQVIHLSRCELLNFTSDKSAVCDEACVIIKSIVLRLRNGGELLEKKSIAWIENKTFRLEAINKSYFNKLRPKNRNATQKISVEELIMIGLQSGKMNLDTLADAKEGIKEEDILYCLVKILPKMSSREWKSIMSLKPLLIRSAEDDGVLNVFNILAETLMIINCIVKCQFTDNQHALACISFCIRNFALFVQDEVLVLPPMDLDKHSEVSVRNVQATKLKAVFQKMLLLLESLPDLIKEPCSIFLLALMKHILGEVVLLKSVGKDYCSEETTTELCSLITLSSIRDVRVALAQVITEAC